MQTLTPRRRKPGTPSTASEPRRPLRWSITERVARIPRMVGAGLIHRDVTVHDWCCLECASATGSAPTLAAAARAVQAHQMAAHAGGEHRG